MNPLLNRYLQQTETYMKTPAGTALVRGILSMPHGTIEAALSACVHEATGIESGEVIEDVVLEFIKQETAKAAGYMKVLA